MVMALLKRDILNAAELFFRCGGTRYAWCVVLPSPSSVGSRELRSATSQPFSISEYFAAKATLAEGWSFLCCERGSAPFLALVLG